jgi:hypothetical protein
MGSQVIPFARDVNPVTGSYWRPPWIEAPAESDLIDDINYVALPAIGATAVVLSRQVEQGYNGILLSLANNFVGGGWVEGSGSVLWQVLRDSAAVPGYDAIPASLGSPANPVRHPSGFRIMEGQLLQLVVKNVNVVVAGQLIGGRWQGWYYPKEYEDPGYSGS